MADFLSKITLPDQSGYPIRASAIPYGEVDDTSTSTNFTATVPGIYALEDGVAVLLKNEVIDSISSVSVNINSLGAKPIYNSNNIEETGTIFNINSTMLLIYNSTLVNGGCWICYKGYDIPPTMTILSYGSSTWDDFIAAYNSNTIVYCRASSNSNPASGNQTRMAFMAYVNNNPPTEVEFQYYRSVSSHSATQQGDQVYIYKLNKNSGWSVTVREAMSKIAAGTGLTSSYSNGTITLSSTLNSINNLVDGSDTGSLRTLSSTVSGDYAFAGGTYTKASSDYQTAIGKYNIEDTDDTYAFIIGNGDSTTANNALTVDWNGVVTTNSLVLQNAGYSELRFITTDGGSPSYIRAYADSDQSEYGNNMVINPGGNLIIGGGESANNVYNNNIESAAGTTENLYLCSDNTIIFYSNCNTSTVENRHRMAFQSDGNLLVEDGGYTSKYNSINSQIGQTIPSNNTALGFFTIHDNQGYGYLWLMGYKDNNDRLQGQLAFRRKNASGTAINHNLNLYIDSSGNRSVSVSDAAAWRAGLGAVNKAGDTMTGSLIVEGTSPYYYSDSTTIDSTIGQTIPDNDTPIGGYDIRDKNDYVCGWFATRKLANDTIRSELVARRKNAGGSTLTNVLYLGINSAGNRYVTVTDSSVWRDALGINYTQVSKTASSVNVTNGTDTNICNTGSLSAGTYVFFYRVSFGSNSTGRRAMFLSTDSSGSNYAEFSRVQVTPVGGSSATEIVGFAIATVSSATTWYLRAYQNSGSTLSCNGQIRYLKIHD